MRKEAAAHTRPIGDLPYLFNSGEMAVEISPEPSEEERKAILEALELEDAATGSGGRAAPPQAWGDPRIVEPGDPRQHERYE
jgi:hypothetical protein